MEFLQETDERGVRERRFDLAVDGRTVPGMLWTPSSDQARALVLIGHGAGLEKRTPYIVSLARRLVRHHGIAAASIDGPDHGDRARTATSADDAPLSWWSEPVIDETVADWKATLAAIRALPEVGQVPLGYWGFSMGTIFGLPFVAAEPDVQVAVLGLMGVVGPTQERFEKDARAVTIPLLFVLQRDDELVPFRSGIILFDAFATTDKRLHVNLGQHSAVPPDEFETTEAFLADHLLA